MRYFSGALRRHAVGLQVKQKTFERYIMSKRLIFFIAITAMLFSVALFSGPSRVAGQETTITESKFYRTENPLEDQYYVILRNDIRDAELETVAQEFAATYNGTVLRYFYETSLNGFAIEIKEQAALTISADPRVEFVEEVDALNPLIEDSKPLPKEETLVIEENTPAEEEMGTLSEKTAKPAEEMGKPAEETVEPSEESLTPEPSLEPSAEEDRLVGADEGRLVAGLTHNPTYILKTAGDPRYFSYENQTIALLGMSGSYVPHIARNRVKNNVYDPVFENCTSDPLTPGGLPKYKQCVNQISDAGLNHMQIWVVLNHSLGRRPIEGPNPRANPPVEGSPYPNEQPFLRQGNRWNLNSSVQVNGINPINGFDNVFFANLKNVVSYCQGKGIIVGIVLFDPWSGEVDGQPTRSPWWPANNTDNLGFTNRKYFTQADNPNTNKIGNPLIPVDSNTTNQTLRNIQVALMKRTAYELKDLKNFYWVLANEPDFDGRALGQPLITWLRYMAKTLRRYEHDLYNDPTMHHMIAANVTTNPASVPGQPAGSVTNVITTMAAEGSIDIITSHYVNLNDDIKDTNNQVVVAKENRYGAIELLRSWNTYEVNGAPSGINTKRWGFSEDRPSGIAFWNDATPPVFVHDDKPWTADSVRVEAWEFFLNGGALFDHLSYRWGNNSGNEPQAVRARDHLGYLGRFMNTIRLDGMKRMMPGTVNSWIESPPPYGSPFWAAMSRPRTVDSGVTHNQEFLFYAHRSQNKGVRYEAYHADNLTTAISIKVKNLGNSGCYKAEWFYPSGEKINGAGGVTNLVLQVAKTEPFNFFPTPSAPTRTLVSPPYKQDVVVRIIWVGSAQCTQ
jgi:hypothetical protein